MKKALRSLLALLLCLLLSLSAASCSDSGSDRDQTDPTDLNEPTAAPTELPTSALSDTENNNRYPGEWIDKSAANHYDQDVLNDIVITAIYSDCFLAEYIVPLPYEMKINGVLSAEWCVGDHVSVTCENCYKYSGASSRNRFEGDMVSIKASSFELEPGVAYKPIIYLYPEEKTSVSVKLNLRGELLCSYPLYESGWQVTAYPDGTLTDNSTMSYNYLFWEGKLDTEYDLSQGFCVKGSDTAAFLNKALEQLGLNRREANEFIVFWLEHMEKNPYNIITFQTDAYTDAAQLSVTPQPDTVIRVFMAYRPASAFVEIPAQQLSAPERTGFTVVEWGGTELR